MSAETGPESTPRPGHEDAGGTPSQSTEQRFQVSGQHDVDAEARKAEVLEEARALKERIESEKRFLLHLQKRDEEIRKAVEFQVSERARAQRAIADAAQEIMRATAEYDRLTREAKTAQAAHAAAEASAAQARLDARHARVEAESQAMRTIDSAIEQHELRRNELGAAIERKNKEIGSLEAQDETTLGESKRVWEELSDLENSLKGVRDEVGAKGKAEVEQLEKVEEIERQIEDIQLYAVRLTYELDINSKGQSSEGTSQEAERIQRKIEAVTPEKKIAEIEQTILAAKKAEAEDRAKDIKAEIDRLTEINSHIEDSVGTLGKNLENQIAERDELIKEDQAVLREIRKLRGDMQVLTSRAELSAAAYETEEAAAIAAGLAANDARIANELAAQQKVQALKSAQEARKASAEIFVEEVEPELARLGDDRQEMQQQLRDSEAEVEHLASEYDQLKGELSEIERKLAETQRKEELRENLANAQEKTPIRTREQARAAHAHEGHGGHSDPKEDAAWKKAGPVGKAGIIAKKWPLRTSAVVGGGLLAAFNWKLISLEYFGFTTLKAMWDERGKLFADLAGAVGAKVGGGGHKPAKTPSKPAASGGGDHGHGGH